MLDALLLASPALDATLTWAGHVTALVATIAGLVWLSRSPSPAAAGQLRSLAAALEGGSVHVDRHLTGCHVHGELGERKARVSFGADEHGRTAILYDLEVVSPAAAFEVAERDARQSLGHLLGLAKEDALDDGSLVVRTSGRGAGKLLQAADVRSALQHLFGLGGVSAVSLRWSGLRVEQRAAVRAQDMLEMLRALHALSRLCGRVPVSELLTVRPRPAAPPGSRVSFAWTGGGSTARCPYCKDELDASAPEVAACDRCGTVHHADCLAEAGGCTIFGCGARRAAGRARA